jgi:hypothetical protein
LFLLPPMQSQFTSNKAGAKAHRTQRTNAALIN